MVENHNTLKRFVANFFNLERYLQPFNEELSEKEIESILTNPTSRSDRQLMDRLLDDPEAIEMIVDQGGVEATAGDKIKSNVFSLAEIRKRYPAARPVKNLNQDELKKVAASHDLLATGEENELKFEDNRVKGFIQLVAFKQDQYMVSGHFELKLPDVSLRLILSNGQVIEQFEREDPLWLFQTIVSNKIVLADSCYELY